MYQSDAIEAYRAYGETFLITVNEGKERDNGEFFNEEVRVKDVGLDPVAFPNADFLEDAVNLGRLKVTNVDGNTDDDPELEKLFSFGARSFSIWTADGEPVFDSGDDFEQIMAAALPDFFNADNNENIFDDRSDDRGLEPEGVTIGKLSGRTYAFIVPERISGVIVYDITDPYEPRFELYINNRNFNEDPQEVCPGLDCKKVGDMGPEGVLFIPRRKSPIHAPLLVVANEVSGSTTVYRIDKVRRGLNRNP